MTSDGEPERAASDALAQATGFWAVHERMQQPLVSLEEAVALARAIHDGTVILTDAADATSSGASGDSNAILRALADGGYQGTVLAPIVDPDAVAASVGGRAGRPVRTTLGGRLDPARFEPMPFEGEVRRR